MKQYDFSMDQPEKQIYPIEDKTKSINVSKCYKLAIIAVFGSSFLLYRIVFELSNYKGCVTDQLHQLTFGINRWILHHIQKVYLLIGQLVIDIWLASMIVFWIIKCQNFRYPCSMAVFFIFRTIFLKTITMPYTSYVVWDSPGVFSLGVPYDHTSDYFFSGHTGTLTLILCQILQVKANIWIKIVALTCLIYTILMLIIVRVHYTIDVFAAIFIGLFVHSLVRHSIFICDKIMSIPYIIANLLMERIKKICEKESQNQMNTI